VTIKDLVRPLPGVRQLSILRQRADFPGSKGFWEKNYRSGELSGPGSYGILADAKARFLNTFVRENSVRSIVEFGCGDGHQLSLAEYPRYVGLDVSRSAIALCRRRFSTDPAKSFFLYDGEAFVDRAGLFRSDLAMSLDVVYHLVEDAIFEIYLTHLFAAGQRYVIVYSSNTEIQGTAPHVRHRCFTRWVEENCPEWRLADVTRGANEELGRADFFVYERSTAQD
jgi:SAM-dependent methyltransferase